ncbi:MAG: hypothetical protein ACXWAC_07590, partial [Usitatibacter sp.]
MLHRSKRGTGMFFRRFRALLCAAFASAAAMADSPVVKLQPPVEIPVAAEPEPQGAQVQMPT